MKRRRLRARLRSWALLIALVAFWWLGSYIVIQTLPANAPL